MGFSLPSIQVREVFHPIASDSQELEDTGNCRQCHMSHHTTSNEIVTEMTYYWSAAEGALQHVKDNIGNLAAVFSKWHIEESQYAVFAGFDMSLVQIGVGHLEQIHIFTSAGVDTNSLLSDLGKIVSPFSAILFTESSSHPIPIFKDDGSAWCFDELVFDQALKFVDARSSTTMLSNTSSLAQSTSKGNAPNAVSNGSTPEGNGEEDGNEEQGNDGRRGGKDPGDNGINGDGGDFPGGGPDEPFGKNEQKARVPHVSFDILANIYSGGERLDPKIFQVLKMEGEFIIRVSPS